MVMMVFIIDRHHNQDHNRSMSWWLSSSTSSKIYLWLCRYEFSSVESRLQNRTENPGSLNMRAAQRWALDSEHECKA